MHPELATIYVPDVSKILETARDHALNYLIPPILKKGSEELDVVKELRPILQDKLSATGFDPALTEFHKSLQLCLVIMDTLSDHS
eukprot:4041523-Pyramimonas_sp.AAC.1